jgi:putative DNA primase/helicase
VPALRTGYQHDHRQDRALTPMTPTDVPARRPAYIEEFLQRRPEHLREFYAAIIDALMPRYHISTTGIAHKPAVGQKAIPFCSLFRVKAMVRTPKSKLWSRVIELIDPDGELVECIISAGTITGKPRDAVSRLADYGLQVYNDHNVRDISHILNNWPVPKDSRLTLIDKVGWTADRHAFILPSGRVMTRKGAPQKYQYGGDKFGEELGSLTEWREGIASLANGNINLVFGIALGFSTALISFTQLNTLVFHIFGKTSQGKTLVLRVALSVWPKVADEVNTWTGTGNGLEGEILKSNNILLGLDELRADSTPELPEVAYRFSNKSGKSRAKVDGKAQDRETQKTNVISSGEYSFMETLKQLGATPTGGQRVRMLDIPAKGKYGIFDDLHGSPTPDAFVTQLENTLSDVSGPPSTAFIERLLEMPQDELQKALDVERAAHTQDLNEYLGIVSGDSETSEIRRVIRSYALISVAGEWATRWGLTGWEPGTASAAVKEVAYRWLEEYQKMPSDQTEELERVRDYILDNEERFIDLACEKIAPNDDTPGYKDEQSFYILTQTFLKLTKDKKKALSALSKAGYLEKGGERNSHQTRLPPFVPKRPRAYRIRRDILDYEGQDDTP